MCLLAAVTPRRRHKGRKCPSCNRAGREHHTKRRLPVQRACAASGQDVSGSTRAADRKRAPPAEQTAAGQAELRLGAVQLCASKQVEVATARCHGQDGQKV